MSTLLQPPSIESRVAAQRDRLAKAVMWVLVGVGVLGLVLAPFVASPPTLMVGIQLSIIAFAIWALVLQHLRPSWWDGGIALSVFAFGLTSFALWALGSPSSAALMAYMTVQLFTAILWGRKPAAWCGLFVFIITAAALMFPEHLNASPPERSDVGFWIGFTLLSGINIIVLLLNGQTIDELIAGMRDSEDRLAAVISEVPDGLVLLRADGVISSVNRAGLRLIGNSSSVVGRRFHDLSDLKPESAARARRLIDQSVSGVGYDERLTLVQDGREIVLQARVGAIPMGRGGAALVLALRDVTEQVEAQQEQEQLRHQVVRQQKLESVGQLAGGIAHDFNNLLTIIRANAEFLENDDSGQLSSHQQASLRDLQNAAQRCASFTQRLLTLSRSHEFGRSELVADQITQDVMSVFSRTLVPNIELETELDAPQTCVMGNTTELEAALLNLLMNAKDAVEGTGRIRIITSTTEVGRGDPLFLPVPKQEVYWTVSVSDNGSGMDEETLERAIEPFFTTKGPGRGTGLGLATVYQLMKQLNGGMHIESAPGHGTTVSLFVPRAGKVAPRKRRASERARSAEPRKHILLVEDDPAVRTTTARALELAGYDVSAVDNAHSALQWFDQRGAPDLLLSDILLPGMSGTELAERVSKRFPAVTVLHISGFTGSEADRPSHPLLTKPFAPTELMAFIREHSERMEQVDV